MIRIATRHLVLAVLPLLCGLAAGWWLTEVQQGCGGLVGPLFAAKCGRVQVEYRLAFQTAGTALGSLCAALIGIALERRRLRRSAATGPTPTAA